MSNRTCRGHRENDAKEATMPTNAMRAVAHHAEQSRAHALPQWQSVFLLLGSVLLCLANIVFVLASPTFASAVALVGQY